jgi:hypothetical protein
MKADVVGLKEALRDLNKLDRELRKEINRDIQKVVKPIAQMLDQRVPQGPPLSGWQTSGGKKPWAPRKFTVRTDARAPRRRVGAPSHITLSVVRISSQGAAVAIADMAGRAGGNTSRREQKYRRPNFASALTAQLGPPSRFAWRDLDATVREANENLKPIIKRVEEALNRDLSNRYRSA